MSAILAVYLGNPYGVARDAQFENSALLKRITDNQWRYYFNECLPRDDLILQKLAWSDAPVARWISLVAEYDLAAIGSKHRRVENLLKAGDDQKADRVKEIAGKLRSDASR